MDYWQIKNINIHSIKAGPIFVLFHTCKYTVWWNTLTTVLTPIEHCRLCCHVTPHCFSIGCNFSLYFPVQVVLLKRTVRSVKIPSTSFRVACVSWAWTTRWWTWLWCSKDCWEITATCRSTCVASLTGQNHQNPSHWSTIDLSFYPVYSWDKQPWNFG